MNKDNIIVVEKKSFIEKHAKEIILGGSLIVGAGVWYMLRKHDMEIFNLNKEKEELYEITCDLTTKIDIINAAASEGLYEEAIATTTRKLNMRQDKLQFILTRERNGDVINIGHKNKLVSEIAVLNRRRDSFIKTQKMLGISDDAK